VLGCALSDSVSGKRVRCLRYAGRQSDCSVPQGARGFAPLAHTRGTRGARSRRRFDAPGPPRPNSQPLRPNCCGALSGVSPPTCRCRRTRPSLRSLSRPPLNA
jgi:hypothetical protein